MAIFALPTIRNFTSFSDSYGLRIMRHLNRYMFIASLLVTTLTTEAVQLGSVKGSAVFGRPLDLTVPVRLDAPFDETANCFSAELFQADSKFDAGRVRLDIQPAANGLDATVRVRSVTPVNEPWAKVILRNNCGAKISRQYDFLTDFADAPAGTAQADISVTPAVLPMTPSSTAEKVRVQRTEMSAKAPLKKSSTQTAVASQKFKRSMPATPEMAKSAVNTASSTGLSKLKMETFELTDEHQVLLKLSSALVAPTGMRTPEEIQALAQATAVWRAINGTPAELQPAATVVTAETEVKNPTIVATASPQPMVVSQKLPRLTGVSEFSNLLVYGLIGLLALTLACIAWLWLRVRKASRAGYGWLNQPAADHAEIEHEPTQFSPSNFLLTQIDDQQTSEPVLESDIEIDLTSDKKVETSPLQNSDSAAQSERQVDSTPVKAADNEIISSLPKHFDDPRFDERVLRSKKKLRADIHDKPITSSAELLDLVLADSPPKLRSISTPSTPEPVSNPSISANTTTVKDDPKGNLIDFEIFAEPIPAEKPSRFAH